MALLFITAGEARCESPEQAFTTGAGRYGAPLKFDSPPVDLDAGIPAAQPEEEAPVRKTADRPAKPAAAEPEVQSREEGAEPAATEETGAPGEGSEKKAADDKPKKPKAIRLFGTVEFRSAIRNLPKWERVMKLEKRSPSFKGQGESNSPDNVRARWKKLHASLEGKDLMTMAKDVNSFFNQWPYKTDMELWRVEDYWATPAEFMKRSGDCEDYAISKYYALRSLGVPAKQLRVAAVKDNIRNLGHAVLIVYTGDEAYVLDNLTNLVLSHKRLSHYMPHYSVNEEYLWRHVKPVARR